MNTTAEQRRLAEHQQGAADWKRWGPTSASASGAPSARTTARRRSLGLLPARPRPQSGVPLGRGRHRRHLRRPAAALLRAGALERARPDPQGATVRPDRQRGQPRRGRQGVLLLPRLHADRLVHEDALQVPAGRVPVRRPGGDQPAREQGRARVRADRHRHLRRGPLLRRGGRVRQGRPRRHPDPDQRDQSRPRRRRAAPAAASGSATPGPGASHDAGAAAVDRAGDARIGSAAILAEHPELGRYRLACDGAPRCCSPRTRPTSRGCTVRRTRRRTSRTASTTRSSTGAPTRSTRPGSAPRPRRTTA